MKTQTPAAHLVPPDGHDYEEAVECVDYDFGLDRRSFVKVLGAGLLIATTLPAAAQLEGRRRGGGGGASTLGARIHLGQDGAITVLTGKVEGGQGARAELSQAAAEELGVQPGQVRLLMAETATVPDDGGTWGSQTTPHTVPAVRRGAAAARELLIEFACKTWGVERGAVALRDGKVVQLQSRRSLGYADLARNPEADKLFDKAISPDVQLTPVSKWKVLGSPLPRPNGRDIVTGAHQYPSDISRPGMLYGKVLRAPSYGARLVSIDLAPAKAMKDVVVTHEDQFVGVAAPNSSRAEDALEAISKTAKWETLPQPSSEQLFDYLKKNAHGDLLPETSPAPASGTRLVRQTYQIPYIQHAPLEPRAAVAEWDGNRVTAWTGSQNPFGCRAELARAFHLPPENVRIIIPDFGAAFGGKHTGECAIEAARLARAAGKPVWLRWTREEEFTWAYFRPAGVIEAEASLDARGHITHWRFVNINSGPSAIDTPYRTGQADCHFVPSKPVLRQGSYRALAATANNFAREAFMDELAAAAGTNPLDFRLAHLENPRLRAVLEKAADKFDWRSRTRQKVAHLGIGLACGTEKGSCVAACVEIEIHPERNTFKVRHVCQAFECGAILNPANLLSQVQGAIIMGMGAALREEIQFEEGRILNASFRKYGVPRFTDVPQLDIHLLDRPDLPPAGAGETPIIAIAPAIANAVFQATGTRIHALPVRLG